MMGPPRFNLTHERRLSMEREKEKDTSFIEFPVHPVSLLEGAKTGVVVVDQLVKVVYGRDWG